MAENPQPPDERGEEDKPHVADDLPVDLDLGFTTTFMGTPLEEGVTEEQALDIAAEKFQDKLGIGAMEMMDLPAELQKEWDKWASAAKEAAAIAQQRDAGESHDVLVLDIDEAALLVSVKKAADEEALFDPAINPLAQVPEPEPPQADPPPEPVVIKEAEVEQSVDPYGDPEPEQDDPWINSVMEMPAGFWDQLDGKDLLVSDADDRIEAYEAFAESLKSALIGKAFANIANGLPPVWHGDFISGKDKNGNLLVFYMATVTTDGFQEASTLDDIVTFEVDSEVFGLKPEVSTFTQMMIPIYNGASKEGASCAEDLDEAGEGLGTFSPSGTILGSTPLLVPLWEKADFSVTTLSICSDDEVFLGCAIMIPSTSDCCAGECS